MNRSGTRLLVAAAAVLWAACSSDSPPQILVFQAAPATIEVGASSTLVFSATAGATLSIDQGVGTVTGQTSVSVRPTSTTTYMLTASKSGQSNATATATVTVQPAQPVAFQVQLPGAAAAGTPVSVQLTALDAHGSPVGSFTGSAALTTDDTAATLPASAVAFTAGQASVDVTFRTAGSHTLTATEPGAASVRGVGTTTVTPGAATRCNVDQLPAGASAGSTLALRVSFFDAFGNVATGYTGTVTLTSSDGRAELPAGVSYSVVDSGAHVFAVRLLTTGAQTLTATDSGTINCSGQVVVAPASIHYLVTLPTDVNAGNTTQATVTVRDAFDNPVPGYAGTVTFATSDPGATAPANLVFDGSQNGTAPVNIAFATLGSQSLTAAESGNALVSGTGTTQVHGLLYTAPPGTAGVIRVVQNAGASSPVLVQLDLVVGRPVRNGYGAGMNLPVDASRAVADATPLVEGNVFNTGQAPKAVAAAFPSAGPTAGVLYSGVSQKAAGAGAVASEPALVAGRVLYSIRLRLNPTAAVGTVFDGSVPMPRFRAAVRDKLGNDTVAQTDFAVGKLEVR